MVSDDLRALADSFGRYRDSGIVIEPEGVAAIEAMLVGLARKAAPLERLTIPDHVRLDPDNLPAGVVPFRRRRPITPPQAERPDGAA